jgi:hypothetical protein
MKASWKYLPLAKDLSILHKLFHPSGHLAFIYCGNKVVLELKSSKSLVGDLCKSQNQSQNHIVEGLSHLGMGSSSCIKRILFS